MSVEHLIDGDAVETVRIESIELVELAELCAVGSSTITIDDVPGTRATVGWKDYEVTEDLCSDPLLLAGSVDTRRIRRGTHKAGPGRDIVMSIRDSNDLLQRRIVTSNGPGATKKGERPEETVGERVDWLLNSDYLSGLVIDSGFVVYPDTVMDENDYRTSRPADVLADCAARVAFNAFVYRDAYSGLASLFFADPNSTLYSSTLRFSDNLDDIDWVTTFPVSSDAELERDPADVVSRIILSYENGRVNRRRAATETAFTERDGMGPTSSVKKRAQAITLADHYLRLHSREDDHTTDTVIVPASKVNLLRAGMRAEFRYEFMGPEGYDEFTWWRTLETRKRFIVSPGGIPEAPDEPLYTIGIRATPQECVASEDTITRVQHITKSATLGTTITLPSPATAGNLLIVFIGNRDEIALGPVGVPDTGYNYVPLIGDPGAPAGTPFNTNYVQADGSPFGCECGHGTLYWKQAEGGETTYNLDNQAAAVFAEYTGFPGTITAIPAAAAETSKVQSASVSMTSGVIGVAAMVFGVLVTRTKAHAGDFTPDSNTGTVSGSGLQQSSIDGAGSIVALTGFSPDGSAVTLGGTMVGPYKDGHPAWGMRMAAFQVCP